MKNILIVVAVAWLLFFNGFNQLKAWLGSPAAQTAAETVATGAARAAQTAQPIRPTAAIPPRGSAPAVVVRGAAPGAVVVPQGVPDLPTATPGAPPPEPTATPGAPPPEPTATPENLHDLAATADQATAIQAWIDAAPTAEPVATPEPATLEPVYEPIAVGTSHGGAVITATVPPADTFKDQDDVEGFNCSPFIDYLPGHPCYGANEP